jgi:hypothetical protein
MSDKKDMEIKTLTSFMLFLSLSPVSIWASSVEELELKWTALNSKERRTFHFNLMKVMAKQAKVTKYSEKEVNVKIVSGNPHPLELILNQLTKEAHANAEDDSIYCNYAGWMTIHNEANDCLPPWKRENRDNSDIQNFGDTYSGKYSCGGAKLIRCNPLIFGPGDDGKGMCATADDNDPTDSTNACLELYTQNQDYLSDHIDQLAQDPEQLSRYLAVAAETLRFCDAYRNDFPYCEDLEESLMKNAEAAYSCSDEEQLITFMPSVLTPFNQDELNQIVEGLGDKAVDYSEELERRQIEAREHNRKVYEDAMKAYSESQRTKDINTRIVRNTDNCLMDSCKGSKNSFKSVEYCARYVKYAMFPPGSVSGGRYGNFSEYPWGSDAVESGEWLRREGFINLMDQPEMQHLTPETAPKGAVIVYEKVTRGARKYNVDGVTRGGPGHIEIKVSDKEYVSDFINDEPTRLGGLRRPIGIYIHMPQDQRDLIQEVPEK